MYMVDPNHHCVGDSMAEKVPCQQSESPVRGVAQLAGSIAAAARSAQCLQSSRAEDLAS